MPRSPSPAACQLCGPAACPAHFLLQHSVPCATTLYLHCLRVPRTSCSCREGMLCLPSACCPPAQLQFLVTITTPLLSGPSLLSKPLSLLANPA
ncbi:hypothetical protein E2C01_040312 [Portunus trituberculatus]|uniref:Uncharacterized protein n=1 Tax=Portunus trituberculatus TaxID=210409 RepID=A0A5B7FG61_PORTR|nr:hypothetical protein [Portunus trituberculatus]